jgi:hypothetical protein
LHDRETRLWVVAGIDEAFVLVTPDYEVEEVGEKVFGEVACFGVCVAGKIVRSLVWSGGEGETVLVLVDAHEVEPVCLLSAGLKESDVFISESTEQPLVSNITHTVESELSATFLEKDGLDKDVV